MAESKNIIIGLLVLAVIILLAFIAFRPIMYSSSYGPYGYQSEPMGPGMMGGNMMMGRLNINVPTVNPFFAPGDC